jgi:hypothetical protein
MDQGPTFVTTRSMFTSKVFGIAGGFYLSFAYKDFDSNRWKWRVCRTDGAEWSILGGKDFATSAEAVAEGERVTREIVEGMAHE